MTSSLIIAHIPGKSREFQGNFRGEEPRHQGTQRNPRPHSRALMHASAAFALFGGRGHERTQELRQHPVDPRAHPVPDALGADSRFHRSQRPPHSHTLPAARVPIRGQDPRFLPREVCPTPGDRRLLAHSRALVVPRWRLPARTLILHPHRSHASTPRLPRHEHPSPMLHPPCPREPRLPSIPCPPVPPVTRAGTPRVVGRPPRPRPQARVRRGEGSPGVTQLPVLPDCPGTGGGTLTHFSLLPSHPSVIVSTSPGRLTHPSATARAGRIGWRAGSFAAYLIPPWVGSSPPPGGFRILHRHSMHRV